jgi:predicted enzyme related to lactoylglutathione lyase
MSKKMSPNIEHFGLKAKDTEKLATWYEQVLGLRIIYKNKKEPPTFFVQGAEGSMLEIFPYSKEVVSLSNQENQKFHIAIGVQNLEETITVLSAKGIMFSEKIKGASGGVRLTVIRDPEGNYVQLIYRPNPFKL